MPSDMNDVELRNMLFPEKAMDKNRKFSDCEKMHRELSKIGVTLTLLWEADTDEEKIETIEWVRPMGWTG